MAQQISKSFTFLLQSRADWQSQASSLTDDVAAEAKRALSVGLISATVALVNGETLQIDCDRLEPSEQGDLLVFAASGLLIATVARQQWISFQTQQPETLHCRPML